MDDQKPFNPNEHLSRVGGNDYLQVAWRIVWLRKAHPGAIIETEEHLHGPAPDGASMLAVFKARVEIPDYEGTDLAPVGGGVATGWGSETSNDFRDYYEKAETKALGRALSALGYGAQFAAEEYEASERKPQQARNDQRVNDARNNQLDGMKRDRSSNSEPVMTAEQWDEIAQWFDKAGMSPEDRDSAVAAIVGHKNPLTKQDGGKVLYKIRNNTPEDIFNLIPDVD